LNKIVASIVICLILWTAVLTALTIAIYINSKSVSNFGAVSIKGEILVSWDSEGTSLITFIDWGIMDPGSNKSIVVYVISTSNKKLVLSMFTSSWLPAEAGNYINVSWDMEGQVLSSRSFVKAVITGQVSSLIIDVDTYSFNMTFTGASL